MDPMGNFMAFFWHATKTRRSSFQWILQSVKVRSGESIGVLGVATPVRPTKILRKMTVDDLVAKMEISNDR